ncbi:MAG: YciI family protein [bacterium]|jgi:hypothetical protein
MKFLCRGYLDRAVWEAMTDAHRIAFMDACCAYDGELQQRRGCPEENDFHCRANPVTLRLSNGHLLISEGSHLEPCIPVGDVLILEARDMNHVIALVSKHPVIRIGRLEICPIQESSGVG